MNCVLLDLYDRLFWERRRVSLRQEPSVLAPPPPTPEGPPSTSHSDWSARPSEAPPHPDTVQAGGFYSSWIRYLRSILNYLVHRIFPLCWRFFPRRRTSYWCPYCERPVFLAEIVETENGVPVCPACRFFLEERE